MPEQQLFESEDHTKAILNQLGDPRIEDALKAIKFTYHEDINQQKWRQIVKKVEKYVSCGICFKHRASYREWQIKQE